MKKISYIYSILMFLLVFASCDDDMEYTFKESPEARVEKNNKFNKDVLTSSEFGWIA